MNQKFITLIKITIPDKTTERTMRDKERIIYYAETTIEADTVKQNKHKTNKENRYTHAAFNRSFS